MKIRLVIALFFFIICSGIVTPQSTKERDFLLEEKQISRMILELEQSRETIALLSKESAAKDALIAKLDAQIDKLNQIAALHKQAADDRDKALHLKDQIGELYKASLTDANKQIERLRKANSRLRKLALVGIVIGFFGGLFTGGN